MFTYKNWYFTENASDTGKLQQALNLSPITAGLLWQRGLTGRKEIEKFLFGTLQDLTDPYLLPGMEKAVDRIIQAVEAKEKIIIYGDYDVDGVCSIVILKECIELLGGTADYYVPDRFEEGYGINMSAVENLIRQQYQLLISVDCGITSIEEANYAKISGMDIIITDHHTPTETLPPAVAVINPKLRNNEDNQYLCGAGITYYLARALHQRYPGALHTNQWLELACLATIADIVPLLGDNHILVREGLRLLSRTERTGLKAIMKAAGLEDKRLTVGRIGFVLAPRLNAAGRLDSARKSIELLLETDRKTADGHALYLNMINDERRQIEENNFEQAQSYISTYKLEGDYVIIAAGENWHPGVIGIVASRLCEKFHRPALVLSWEGEYGKGSGRSIKGFDLYQALHSCRDYLEQFGGHQMAAGFTVARQKFADFAAALNEYSRGVIGEDLLYRTCWADGEIQLQEINVGLIEELKTLEPFGEGNPQPAFIIRRLPIHSLKAVGSQKEHISFHFSQPDLQGIAFRKPEYMKLPYEQCWHDIIGEISENEFRGKKTMQIRVKEMKMSVVPDDIRDFSGMEAIPYRQLKLMIEEMRAGRPVIVLFPTVRCLLKYKTGLESCIRSKFLHSLHGHLRTDEMDAASNLLLKGQAGVFLLTRACFQELLVEKRLPEVLKHILTIWQEESVTSRSSWEYLLEDIQFRVSGEQIMQSLKKMMDYDVHKRNLIYSNRNSTISGITAQLPAVISEAAEDDHRRRRTLRRRFSLMETGAYITDGNYTIGNEFIDIDNVILADLPFSIFEAMFVLDQIKNGHSPSILMTAREKQQEQNWAYLRQRYPEEYEVSAALDFLQGKNGGVVRQDLHDLSLAMEDHLGFAISKLKMLSILRILSDSGLCQINKQGSIMEIKYLAQAAASSDITRSALYQEGIHEKKIWEDFSQSLNIK